MHYCGHQGIENKGIIRNVRALVQYTMKGHLVAGSHPGTFFSGHQALFTSCETLSCGPREGSLLLAQQIANFGYVTLLGELIVKHLDVLINYRFFICSSNAGPRWLKCLYGVD